MFFEGNKKKYKGKEGVFIWLTGKLNCQLMEWMRENRINLFVENNQSVVFVLKRTIKWWVWEWCDNDITTQYYPL